MQTFIEPGESFPVPYGSKGKTLTAVSLSLRQQREVMRLVANADNGSQVDKFDMTEQALKLCFPQITDEQIDDLTFNMACQAIGSALASTRLDEVAEKKSE